MNRDDVTWRGYWPACPTPFTASGALDLDSLRELIEWYLGEGMHGIFINGTTGEWFSQSPDERRLVAETAIEQVAGRATVVIGCTSLTSAQAVELGRHAIAAGADGIGSTPPPYSKTYPDETVRYLKAWLAVADDFKSNKKKVSDTIYEFYKSKGYKMSPATFEKAIDTVEVSPVFPSNLRDYMQEQAQVLLREKKIKQMPDWSKALRPEFMQKAKA